MKTLEIEWWKMNILISKLCNFSAAGRKLSRGGTRIRSASSSIAVSFVFPIFHQLCAKNQTQMDHPDTSYPVPVAFEHDLLMSERKDNKKAERKKRKMFLIIFLCRRLYLGAMTHKIPSSVWCRSHNRIMFDIYYRQTKEILSITW